MTRLLLIFAMVVHSLGAADWPEWRGMGRAGVWSETGIAPQFPAAGLKTKWRVPVRAGFAGPAVAGGRVFVTDFAAAGAKRGTERALAIDEASGKVLWIREWPANYQGISYATGPRATPTAEGDRVYIAGAAGALLCLDVKTGEVIWSKDYVRDFQTVMPVWGIASAPLVDGNRLIAIVGGQPDAKVVAFHKRTGKELWRAIASDSEPGYCQPLIVEAAGGRRQLIIWHPVAVTSLDPVTGKVNWDQPMKVHAGMTLATPVVSGAQILVSAFYNGSMLVDLSGRRIWQGKSDSEINTDGLHAVVNTPVIDGDHIYGICSYGQFRCLNLRTGERVWETPEVTREKARWASGFIVRQGDRYFINNDRGELIMARFSPEGYREIGRTHLIKPTSDSNNRRELGAVNWTHPAYANRHLYTRNDEELIAVSLAQ
ncbi:MAG: pyrrolo-quinoline quinone [Acidobacteria bacterium]|nr:pyrrolo-quinoline quinone [Acidobacteriota bacterium]